MALPAFEAVGIVAYCALMLVIGLLMAVAWTFHTFAVAIDVDILGLHPLRKVANGIEATIVHSCNVGIEKLGHLAHTLWGGITWSINQMAQAVMGLSDATHDALKYVKDHTIDDVVNPSLTTIRTSIGTVSTDFDAFKKAINKDVNALQTTVDGLPATITTTANNVAGGLVSTLRRDVGSMLDTLRRDIGTDIGIAEKAAEKAGTTAVDALRSDVVGKINLAVEGVEGDLSTFRTTVGNTIADVKGLEGQTADALRDFIGKVPLTDIAAVIAAVPILATAVATLEAETGLSKPECRRKVSSLCTTDETLFNVLMSGLTLVGLGIGLEEIIHAIIGLADTISGPLEDFVRG